jgi:hypothetical protein
LGALRAILGCYFCCIFAAKKYVDKSDFLVYNEFTKSKIQHCKVVMMKFEFIKSSFSESGIENIYPGRDAVAFQVLAKNEIGEGPVCWVPLGMPLDHLGTIDWIKWIVTLHVSNYIDPYFVEQVAVAIYTEE